MLQCTEGLRSGCSLRLTVQCVPQDEMCRSRGVGMTKFQMSKADLHNKVHLCCPQPGPRSSHATAAACVAHGPLLSSGLAVTKVAYGRFKSYRCTCRLN